MTMEQSQLSPSTYNHAAEVIKTAILQGQYEALKGENRIQLAVYFGIGKYVSQNSRKEKWGSSALAVISERLRKILPGLRGFSAESLKKMRQFYESWTMLESEATVAVQNGYENNSVIAITEFDENEIDIYHEMSVPNTTDFPATEFLTVPFTHHSRILSKAKTLSERYYYIRRCAHEHLSVDAVVQLMKEDAFHTQQSIPNNFSKTMMNAKEARKAVMMFKDEYALDFINVEEIGERDSEDIDERVVEQQRA